MNCQRTQGLPPHLQSAKVTFADLVEAFGGQGKASAETGKGQSRISSYGLTNTADFPPLDVIDFLEARTVGMPGHPHVTRWLCRRRGGEFVQLPDASGPPMEVSALVAELVKTSGQLGSGLLNDLEGGVLSGGAAWRRLGDADALVRVAIQIQHLLQQCAAEESQ